MATLIDYPRFQTLKSTTIHGQNSIRVATLFGISQLMFAETMFVFDPEAGKINQGRHPDQNLMNRVDKKLTVFEFRTLENRLGSPP